LILFGLDAGQLYSIKEAKNTYFYNTAENQLNNAVERLIALNRYEGFDELLVNWNQENKALLPSGFGTITGSFPKYSLTIYWGKISQRCEKQKIGSSGCLIKKINLV